MDGSITDNFVSIGLAMMSFYSLKYMAIYFGKICKNIDLKTELIDKKIK